MTLKRLKFEPLLYLSNFCCSFHNPALAPSSTFAASISVASPAKLQAAATLAEVANGIEGEVRLEQYLMGQL